MISLIHFFLPRFVWQYTYLHNTIRSLRILILDNVFLQHRKGHFSITICPGTPRVSREEFVQDFTQQLMRHHLGVFMIGDDDAAAAFGTSVRVEGVGLFLDVLPLARLGAFGNGFGEDGEELADVGAGEAREGGEVTFGGEFDCGFGFVAEDLVWSLGQGGVEG